MAVVKADAYNHGVEQVAPVMADSGADAFGVATLAEAMHLRSLGIVQPILCWIWSPEQDFRAAIDAGIDLAVISPGHAEALIDASAGRPVRVSIKVDTGLHRSGVDEAEWESVFTAVEQCHTIEVTGLFTHLACADDPSHPETDRQEERFSRAIDVARNCGLEVPVNHICLSLIHI